MPGEHASIFSYNITRPYPFRWFTPVVLVGGVLATVLFSILNLVSNGYYLQVRSSTNPAELISESLWFENWPSYFTAKIQPSCQEIDLPINSRFFTNQSGLTYTLTGAWQENSTGARTVLPSLTYLNHVLRDCVFHAVDMDLESMDRLASQIAYTQWGIHLWGYTTCSTVAGNSTTMFNLTAEYDYIPPTVSFDNATLYSFVSQDKMERASLWWGESLLSMYWVYFSRMMQDIGEAPLPDGKDPIRKATLSFTLKDTTTRSSINGSTTALSPAITSLDFFDLIFCYLQDLPGQVPYPIFVSNSISDLDSQQEYPNIWSPADSLAKSFYSTIMADLGQSTTETFPNILTDADTLQTFTSDFPNIINEFTSRSNVRTGPALQDYDTLRETTGPLGTTPSVIFTKYICQVPQRKSVGAVIVAVLIADLVFL